MKKIFLLIILLPNLLCAQITVVNENGRKDPTLEMITQVKLLSQFMDRFNYTKTFDDRAIDDEFKQKIDRATYVKLLFNNKDLHLINSDSIPTDYSRLRDKFIAEVCNTDKQLFIDKNTDQLFAYADCDVTYKGKPQKMTMILQRTVSHRKVMQWKIIDAKAKFLKIPQADDNKIAHIPPNSHETNFMSLLHVFEDKEHFLQVFDNSNFGKVNILPIFTFELYNGNLKYKHVTKIEYKIKAISGWKISIENFNRKDVNSGWLISDIKQIR